MIVISGVRLTRYADKLSDQIQLGKVWVGIMLLGLVTSLPELVTSLIAVISIGAEDLAVGNLLGSNNFNPMLIVVMDIIYRKGSVTNAIVPRSSHKISAFLAMSLAIVVIMQIFFRIPFLFSLGSFLIVLIYFGGMRYLAHIGKAESQTQQYDTSQKPMSLSRIWINLIVSAILIVLAAMWLTHSADTIAEKTGLGRTFVGSILLAIVTSLPEMVVTISALKLGSFDLAVGNIFGSNMTNTFILVICDMVQPGAAILNAVAPTHIFTAILSVILVGVVVTGIYTRNKKTIFGLGWDSVIMIFFFIMGTGLLYKLK